MTFTPGTKLGHYQIHDMLGAGGMGIVYQAHDIRLNRAVALKVLAQELRTNHEAIARFTREAKATAALSHPNIVAIYDIGDYQDAPFVVMELLHGENLRARLRQATLDWRETVRVGAAVASGLAAAHAAGIVHRDLKPENIFLTKDSQVKILDFGLAHFHRSAPEQSEAATDLFAPTVQAVTKPGMLLGTPGYMAPEQTQGREITAATDLFALGCVLYEMLAGQPLFLRGTTAETLAATLRDQPPALSEFVRDLPPQLEQLLLHCVTKDALQRAQSAQEVASELQGLLSAPSQPSFSTIGSRQRWLARPSRRTWLGLALSSLALGGGWAWYKLLRQPGYEFLAILPIHNESNDPKLTVLCDGLTETLINKFSKLPQLKVIASTTSFEFKNQTLDLQRLKRELAVDAVLTGKLTRVDEFLVVHMELVDVAQRTQLWGDSYQRSQTDIFILQEEIAREIAGKLQPRLTTSQTEQLAKRDTSNATANDFYFKGLSALSLRDAASNKQSVRYFDEALKADPNYALAMAGLARAYILAEEWVEPDDAMEKARTYATRALELDSALASAHTSLGVVKMLQDWNFKQAEQSFKQAIEQSPNDATVYHWYAEYLTAMARHDEAIAAITLAKDLDPLSVPVNRDVAWHYYCARQYDKALAQCQLTLAMRPAFPIALSLYGRVLLQMGRPAEALKQLQQVADLQQVKYGKPGNGILSEIIYAHALAGNRTEARQMLATLTSQLGGQAQLPLITAATYVLLGEQDAAFTVLDQALKSHSAELVYLKAQPPMAPLSNNWRFIQLLKQIGLLD